MEVSSFVLLYFGRKIFVRCSEVSFVQRCPLMEVPLYHKIINDIVYHIQKCYSFAPINIFASDHL